MPENQKKVSFKIQFSQNKAKRDDLPPSQPRMISHWQYGRIATIIAIIVLISVVAINLMTSSKPEPVLVTKQDSPLEQTKAPTKPDQSGKKPMPATVAKTEQSQAKTSPMAGKQLAQNKNQPAPVKTDQPLTSVASGVLRAQLASGVWEDEPFGEVSLPLKVNSSAATGLFYFTELQGMQGQSVYHVWKRNGKIIFQQKKDITEANLKTYTSKLFTMASLGSWTVSLTDSNLVPLHTLAFTVVAQ